MVDHSPAAAMRAHFAKTRGDRSVSSPLITLLDPTGLWAPGVIQALSEAASMPVQRLVVRERSTLRALATISRTSVPRHRAFPLKVYHADVRATGLEGEEIISALAEGSHMTAVIIGTLQPQALADLLGSLVEATRAPSWRCEWLTFILPPGMPSLRRRVLDQPWPSSVRVAAVVDALSSAAGVWNSVLTAWEATTEAVTTAAIDRVTAAQALRPVAGTEGLLACGLVDLAGGDLLASESRDNDRGAPLGPMASALCAARRAQIDAAGPLGTAPEEILITSGTQQLMLRTLPRHQRLGFIARLERSQANLALLRFRMLEAEQHLLD
ncbi:MAG: hypothetical protein HY021_01330 [Burkholderiales bacterium]|nr:hypothetical protein [Burkholderiales bacterium]